MRLSKREVKPPWSSAAKASPIKVQTINAINPSRVTVTPFIWRMTRLSSPLGDSAATFSFYNKALSQGQIRIIAGALHIHPEVRGL
jgi:hypothetical protein